MGIISYEVIIRVKYGIGEIKFFFNKNIVI